MRQISIRQLRANMAKEIESLPFEVTRNGSVIAVIDSPAEKACTQNPTKRVHKPKETVYTEPQKTESVYTRQFNPYSKDKQLGKKH